MICSTTKAVFCTGTFYEHTLVFCNSSVENQPYKQRFNITLSLQYTNCLTSCVSLPVSCVSPEPPFALRVLVKDQVTRRRLGGAHVGVFVNHTLSSQALTGEKGEVLLRVPYSLGLSLTIVASMEGYVLTPLPWRTTKRPSE